MTNNAAKNDADDAEIKDAVVAEQATDVEQVSDEQTDDAAKDSETVKVSDAGDEQNAADIASDSDDAVKDVASDDAKDASSTKKTKKEKKAKGRAKKRAAKPEGWMSESQLRKAERSGNPAKREAAAKQREAQKKMGEVKKVHRSRDWVPYVFVPIALLGVIWLIAFYVFGSVLPFMVLLGNWNFVIGLGLIAASFVVATLWE